MESELSYRHFGSDVEREYRAILSLTLLDGHPEGFEKLFDRERHERWHRHNPEAYAFYERGGRVVGFRAMFPVQPALYWQLRRTRLMVRDLHRDHILTPEEAERCRRTGLAYVIAAWSESDRQVSKRMTEDSFDKLGSCNLQGIYAETSGIHEDFCQDMTLLYLGEKGTCPHTGRPVRGWCADREYLAEGRSALAGFFRQIDRAFGPPSQPAPPLRLREREKAVAYLYFVRRRTREETAVRLSIAPSTVQDHVNAILRAVEPFLERPYIPDSALGDSPRTRVGTLFELHPTLLTPDETKSLNHGDSPAPVERPG